MTAREKRLRRRVDDLLYERDELLRALIVARKRGPFRHCVYCGAPCYGLACPTHRDVLHVDPHFTEMRRAA